MVLFANPSTAEMDKRFPQILLLLTFLSTQLRVSIKDIFIYSFDEIAEYFMLVYHKSNVEMCWWSTTKNFRADWWLLQETKWISRQYIEIVRLSRSTKK